MVTEPPWPMSQTISRHAIRGVPIQLSSSGTLKSFGKDRSSPVTHPSNEGVGFSLPAATTQALGQEDSRRMRK